MRKLTKKSLDELASTMPRISEMEQRFSVGGGNGSKEMPYTVEEFDYLSNIGLWKGGYVDGWGYTGSETVVVASGTSNGGSTSGNWNDPDPFGDTNISGSWDASGNFVSGDWSGGIWSGGVWIENPDNNQTGNGNTGGGGGGSSSGQSSTGGFNGNTTPTDCVAYTIAHTLSSMGINTSVSDISAWVESKYGKNGVPGNQYYTVLDHFLNGNPTPIPPSGYNRYDKNEFHNLLAAIGRPEGGEAHAVTILEIENGGTRVTYLDNQRGGIYFCTTLDIRYLYRVDGVK